MKKIFSIKVRSRLLINPVILLLFVLAALAGFGGQAIWGEEAQAASDIQVATLPAPAKIDETARQQYIDARLAEQERQRQAELQRQKAAEIAVQSAAISQKSNAATQPTAQGDRLIIPKIGLNSSLATVDLTSGGEVDVHPSLPGRWNQSAQPGSNGAIFVDGHNNGIFAALGRLAIGDQVAIVSSGATFTYTVVHTEVTALELVDMRKALSVWGGGAQGLNLMTCAGTPMGNTYSHRLTVYAVR